MYCRCHSSKTSSCQSRSVWSRSAGEVLVDEPVDERRLEIAALARSRRLEHVGEQLGQAAAEPDAERHAEALLLPVEDRRRQQRAHATSFSTCLRRPFVILKRRRQRRREVDDLVVEQRHARLDRVRHAHAIDLRQHVFGQIGLEVEAHHPAVPAAARRSARSAAPSACSGSAAAARRARRRE